MAIDKNKLIRYRIYDRCFSNFNIMYTRSMLRDKVNEELYLLGLDDVGESTINHDISPIDGNFVRDMNHFIEPDVELVAYKCSGGIAGTKENTYYRYSKRGFSIWKIDLDEIQLQQLQNALLMLQKFKGLPNMDWMDDLLGSLCKRYKIALPQTDALVELDYNPDLVGLDSYFSPILEAAIQKRALTVEYNSAYQSVCKDTIHPYFIKEYNNRWFVFGWSENDKRVNNMAIDRFVSVEQSNVDFISNDEIDFNEYFDEIIGVTRFEHAVLQEVRLRFSPQRYRYVKSKPLHSSQHNYDETCEVKIRVFPNNELEALILSFGPDVTVLEPISMRESIQKKIRGMSSNY